MNDFVDGQVLGTLRLGSATYNKTHFSTPDAAWSQQVTTVGELDGDGITDLAMSRQRNFVTTMAFPVPAYENGKLLYTTVLAPAYENAALTVARTRTATLRSISAPVTC